MRVEQVHAPGSRLNSFRPRSLDPMTMYSWIVFAIGAAFVVLHYIGFADIYQWLVVWIDEIFQNGNAFFHAMWAVALPQIMIGYSLIEPVRRALFNGGMASDEMSYTVIAIPIVVTGVVIGNLLYAKSGERAQTCIVEGELRWDLRDAPVWGGIAYTAYVALGLFSLIVGVLARKLGYLN